MGAATHHIRRQTWRVRTGSRSDALALRQRLRRAWHDELEPAFEHAFDDAAHDAQVWHIPRLVLHVRVSDGEHMAESIARQVREQLHNQLPRLLRGDVGVPGEDREVVAADPVEYDRAVLLHYLHTGTLPWPASADSPTVQTETLRRTCAEELTSLATTATQRADASFVFRLLQLLEPDDRRTFADVAATQLPPARARALRVLLDDDAEFAQTGTYAQLTAAALLITMQAVTRTAIAERLRAAGVPDGIAGDVAALAGDTDAAAPAPPPNNFAMRTADVVPHDASAAAYPPLVRDDRDVSSKPSSTAPALATEDTRPGAIVDNAGLVLLHPFVASLFAECGITHDGELPDTARPRAAALLHWIATGRDDVCELELGLIRTLLGVSLDAPLPVGAGLLTARDRDEGEALLRAVIGHWSALRQTSPASFRATFLERRGLVEVVEGGYIVKVASSPFDVLLAHLPWSISVIRLPWMTGLVHTEWTR